MRLAPRKPIAPATKTRTKTYRLNGPAAAFSAHEPLPAKSLATRLSVWFESCQRDLPWRVRSATTGERDGYHALVAETMLQQTQVSRVVAYFNRFLALFPSIAALAKADESAVLAAWSGLGYYRRARNLHAAARLIVDRFGGEVPREVDDLLSLPGVGRYTAGAISSIAFGRHQPIVDGNVMRVLLRLNNQPLDQSSKTAAQWAWAEAERLVNAAQSPPLLNEGMMELGATICLPQPARPDCPRCPLRTRCRAHAAGTQFQIPLPKPSKKSSTVHITCLVITRADGAVLFVQRPSTGMWQNMWQVPTVETDSPAGPTELAATASSLLGDGSRTATRHCGDFEHQTTHRLFVVHVRACGVTNRAAASILKRAGPTARWVQPTNLDTLGLASIQQRVLTLAAWLAPSPRRTCKAAGVR